MGHEVSGRGGEGERERENTGVYCVHIIIYGCCIQREKGVEGV